MATKGESIAALPARLLAVAAFVIVLFGLRQAASVMAPALTALLVGIAFIPLQRRLGHRIGRVPGFLATLAVVLAIILGLVAIAGAGLVGLADAFPRYSGRTDDVQREATRLLVPSGIEAGRLIEAVRGRAVDNVELAMGAVGEAAKGLADFGVVVLLAAFILADAVRLREKANVLGAVSHDSLGRLERTIADIRTYLRVTAISGALIAGLCTILFLLVGVDLALLWGALLFVLSFVPYLGFWGALVAPITLATLEKGVIAGLVVTLGSLAISGAVGNIVKPKLLADGVNLSPFTVVFSVVFWAYILGPLGALLAVPLTLAVKELVFDPDPGMMWLSTLMGNRADDRLTAEADGQRPHEAA